MKNFTTRIEGIIEFNPYDVATQKVLALIKEWVLEAVGELPEDEKHKDSYSLGYESAQKQIKQRILKDLE